MTEVPCYGKEAVNMQWEVCTDGVGKAGEKQWRPRVAAAGECRKDVRRQLQRLPFSREGKRSGSRAQS